jgi:hypothetical protein
MNRDSCIVCLGCNCVCLFGSIELSLVSQRISSRSGLLVIVNSFHHWTIVFLIVLIEINVFKLVACSDDLNKLSRRGLLVALESLVNRGPIDRRVILSHLLRDINVLKFMALANDFDVLAPVESRGEFHR